VRRSGAAALLVGLGVALALGGPDSAPRAFAQSLPGVPRVDVVKVQGVIDPALADYVRGTVRADQEAGATVVLQIDSRGSYGDEAQRLGEFLRGLRVPVISWIGPAGARVSGGALFLAYSASLVAVAPGAGIGPARPFDLGTTASREDPAEASRLSDGLKAIAVGAGAPAGAIDRLVSGTVLPAQPVLDARLAAFASPGILDLLAKLDGRVLRTPGGEVTLATLNRPGRPVQVQFHEIGLIRRVLHAVSTPTAVYVLLVLGLWGVAFELTQPGFGFAGIAGLLALALAGYGLAVIPVHVVGIALILGGTALQALDVLIRRVAWLTLAGTVTFGAGSIVAWRGVSPDVDVPLWLVVLATLGGALYFGFALTVALQSRQRVQRAQVGLVGLTGEARQAIDPEGAVFVKGALWKARSEDGPIPKGSRVRVRGVDGLILRVEREQEPEYGPKQEPDLGGE
jgi:membrane-bound serine protease (ClpP class)